MTEERKPQVADKYILRLPDGMRDRIAEASKANKRSMNAEIIARLDQSFGEGSEPTLLRLLARLELQLVEAEQLSSMADIDGAYKAQLLMAAITHLENGTKPSKKERADWNAELAVYKKNLFDELEIKLKNASIRLDLARSKLMSVVESS